MNAIGGFLDQTILSAIYLTLVNVPQIGFALPYLAWVLIGLIGTPTVRLLWNHKPTATETPSIKDATKTIEENVAKSNAKLENVKLGITEAENKKKTLDQQILEAEAKLKEKTEALKEAPTEAIAPATS